MSNPSSIDHGFMMGKGWKANCVDTVERDECKSPPIWVVLNISDLGCHWLSDFISTDLGGIALWGGC